MGKGTMTLYHGSPIVVQKPEMGKCKPRNDYGPGFYCTCDIDLASEWACRGDAGGVVNEYQLNCAGLNFLDLDANENGVLGWVATLMKFRNVDRFSKASEKAVARFIEAYSVDVSKADVVQGYRADDSYFDIVRAFTADALSVDELEAALRLGGLGRQTVLRTQRAFDALSFAGQTKISAREWLPRRNLRNERAKRQFIQIRDASDVRKGERFIDIARRLS